MSVRLAVLVIVTIQTGIASESSSADGHRVGNRIGMHRCGTIAYSVQIAQTGQLIVAARMQCHVIGTCERRLAVFDAGARTAALVQSAAELTPELA